MNLDIGAITHELTAFVERHSAGVVHAAEVAASTGAIPATEKKNWATDALTKLADAWLEARGLSILDVPINGMIESGIELALTEFKHLLAGMGGFGQFISGMLGKGAPAP